MQQACLINMESNVSEEISQKVVSTDLKLKSLSPTTEDVDLDTLDLKLKWLDLPTLLLQASLSPSRFTCDVCGNGVDSVCKHDNPVISAQNETKEI